MPNEKLKEAFAQLKEAEQTIRTQAAVIKKLESQEHYQETLKLYEDIKAFKKAVERQVRQIEILKESAKKLLNKKED